MKPTDLVQRAAPLATSRAVSGPASTAQLVQQPIEDVLSRSTSVLEHAQELVHGAAMRAEAAQGKIVLDRTRKLGTRSGQLSATVGLPVQLAEDLIAVRAGTHAARDAIKALDAASWRTGLPHGTHVANRAESSWDEMQQAVEAVSDRSEELAAASAKLARSTPDGFQATWKDGLVKSLSFSTAGLQRAIQEADVATMWQKLTSRGVAVNGDGNLEAAVTLVDPVIRHKSSKFRDALFHPDYRTSKTRAVKRPTAVSSLANDLRDVQQRIGDVRARIRDAMTDVQAPDADRQLGARTAAHAETIRESHKHVMRLLAQ